MPAKLSDWTVIGQDYQIFVVLAQIINLRIILVRHNKFDLCIVNKLTIGTYSNGWHKTGSSHAKNLSIDITIDKFKLCFCAERYFKVRFSASDARSRKGR